MCIDHAQMIDDKTIMRIANNQTFLWSETMLCSSVTKRTLLELDSDSKEITTREVAGEERSRYDFPVRCATGLPVFDPVDLVKRVNALVRGY